MILCGIVCAIMAVLLLWMRKTGRDGCQKRVCGIVLAGALLGLLSGAAGQSEELLQESNKLERREGGGGDYETSLEVEIEETGERYAYEVTVPEKTYSEAEEQKLLAAAWEEIQAEFLGTNDSLEHVCGNVTVRTSYQNGAVSAEWGFADYDVMDTNGNVVAEVIPQTGIVTGAWVELFCGSSARTEELVFVVFAGEQTREERLAAELAQTVAEQQTNETDYIELPEESEGQTLLWKEKEEHLPEKLLLLGMAAGALLPLAEQSRREEQRKKRKEKLALEYPDMVSKLALLLAAGMTVQGAWRRVAEAYQEKRRRRELPEMPAYEEMLVTCRELDSGAGEENGYGRFGERCGQNQYRRLGNLLSQNLKLGNKEIVALLEAEAETAFEERKNAARRYGEEAATKLLAPMLLMFGIVLLILIYPAVVSFQM